MGAQGWNPRELERIEALLRRALAASAAAFGSITPGAATVVWRPGAVSAGNVFATWAEVVARVATMQGAVNIAVDMDGGAAIIPAGAWDLRPAGISGPVKLVAAGKLTAYFSQFVTIANAVVTIHGLTGLDGIQIINQSTASVIAITVVTEQKEFSMHGYAAIYQSVLAGAANSFIRVSSTAGAITLNDASFLSTLDGGTNAVTVAAGAFLQLLINDASGVDPNQLVAPAGTALVVVSGDPIPPFASYSSQAGAPTIRPSGIIQRGTAAIVGGTGKTAAISAFINGTSTSIQCTLKTPVGDALTVKYAALLADRVNGSPGTFMISALVAAGGGAVNGADTSTVDWIVKN